MKKAILFSGQGAQYPGMGKDLYDHYKVVRDVFNTAHQALGRDIAALCFEGSQEELDLTHNTQVCMLAVDVAAGFVLRSEGIQADCAAGFSLGEYAALVYAGAIALEDAFRVVQLRADAMQEAVPVGYGGMAALMGANGVKAEEICAKVTEGYVVAANYNSPVQTVISGSLEGVNAAITIAQEIDVKAIRLAVSAPFHCKLMEPAAICVDEALKTIKICKPVLPVFFNVTGNVMDENDNVAELLVRQAMSPVRWVDTLENMRSAGVTNFIECGAGKTLWGLTRKTLKDVTAMKAVDYRSVCETVTKLSGD